MYDSLQPCGLQHSRLLCHTLSPRVCSNSCPLSKWCYLIISSSASPSPLPQSFPMSGSFPNELALCFRWPKYQSFSISPSNEYSGLVSFRIDWFDLLVLQGTLKSLLQHHNSKATILQCLPFYMVQLSHLYMTTSHIWTFIDKVMSLLFNMLSRFVISFLKGASFHFIAASHYPQWFWSPRK